jgi:thiol-disulfide isomerase/thioredoxin
LAGYVALVDNELILRGEFARVQAIDRVMSSLLGIAEAEPMQLLQQMVNHRLVLRQVDGAGPAGEDVRARLAALLAANGKTQAELDALLAANDVPAEDFTAYLAELILVDEFAHAAAARGGMAVDDYVEGLQAAARIHLGDPLTATVALAESSPVSATAALSETAPLTASKTAPEATPAALQAPAAEGTAGWQVLEPRGVAVGQLAPPFALLRLGDGKQPATLDDLLGTPTVLTFWTTWCPYCLQQTPILVAAAARMAGQEVQFVGIDVKEQAGVVAGYVAQHAIPYPILLDTDGTTAAAYAVTGYPTTYFLDATGRIVALQIGAMSEEQLSRHLDQLLASQ